MGGEQAIRVTRRSAIGLTGAALAVPAAPFSSRYPESQAMAFTPSFVDLVRNYTTTTGTADFKLGAAVNGFASFAAALQPGDSFYYSAIGVDRPDEREVGRGTLQANGTIVRDPVSGTKTDFSSGTKTLALIAAAEWFNLIQAGGGAGPGFAVAATKQALATATPSQGATFLTEAGCEGLFAFQPSDLSPQVSIDPRQGIYLAPASDPSGASGAWVRAINGPINAAWFGLAEGDDAGNGAANTAAMAALLGVLAAREVNAINNNHGLERVVIPYGVYWFADNGSGAGIEIDKGALILEGSAPAYNRTGTALKFPTGVTGIRIQNEQSSGALGKEAAPHASSQGTTLRNLNLIGAFAGTEREAHGVHARTTITCENVNCQWFEGDGFHLSASASSASGEDPPYGNVNVSQLVRCNAGDCRDGIFFDGGNSNAGVIVGFNANINRRWGINDRSQLGNSYFGGQLATNGISIYNDGIAIAGSVVSHNGNRYGVIAGQEAGASTNAPSGDPTDNDWWYYHSAGGPTSGRPAWSSGMAVRAGGCVRDDSSNSRSVYSGVYAEADQGKAQVVQRSLIVGGYLSNWVYQNPNPTLGTSVISTTNNGTIDLAPALEVDSGTITTTIGQQSGNPANIIVRSCHPTVSPTGHTLSFDTGNGDVRFAYNASGVLNQLGWILTGPTPHATFRKFGTSAPVSGAFFAPLLMLSDGSANPLNARLLFQANGAAPATGDHGVGELCINRANTSGLIGWHCTAAGAPGTWEALWSGYGKSAIGYAAGAGGTVTQTTSKATGVTLNKLSGEITLNAAALAANTAVTFVLTNSQIAAGDRLILNHMSGGTFGAYLFDGRSAAGSATIMARNVTSGALSEVIVIGFAVVKAATA
jgi:hypothetical protein